MNNVNEFKKKIEELLPLLKKAYIAYYGKEYEERINSVINSIKIVFLDGKNLCKDEEEKIISINEINSNDEQRINNAEKGDSKACVIPKTYPPIAILRPSKELSLHILIHEINHTLHNEKELRNMGIIQLPPIFHEGIKAQKDNLEYDNSKYEDLIYEIINDYMSQDILEILKVIINQSDKKIDGLDFKFDYFHYLHLDQVDNYTVKDFYEQNKDEIKRLLVLARGEEIENKYSYFKYDLENEKLNYININFEKNSSRMLEQQGLTEIEAKEQTLQFLILARKQK